MSNLSFTEAFAKYGAKLKNAQWAFSAIASDGAFVMSCWQHKLTMPQKGMLRYTERLSDWHLNAPGKNLLIEHLTQAHAKKLPVRLVIASTKQTEVVDAGLDASGIAKTFDVKTNFVGEVTSFDGDTYVIEFRKQDAAG